MQRFKLGSLLLATVLLSACGPLAAFRASFNATKPFIQELVVQKVITQEKADLVTHDVGDGVDSASRGEQCLNAITVSGTERKVAKAKCYYQVAQDLRAILERHNIGGDERLDRIAALVGAAIEAFEAYNSSGPSLAVARKAVGSKSESRNSIEAVSGEDADKKLEAKLRSLSQQLKAVTSK